MYLLKVWMIEWMTKWKQKALVFYNSKQLFTKKVLGVPSWLSGLRIQPCHCFGSGPLWLRFDPGPGNLDMPWAWPKGKKEKEVLLLKWVVAVPETIGDEGWEWLWGNCHQHFSWGPAPTCIGHTAEIFFFSLIWKTVTTIFREMDWTCYNLGSC